MPVFVGQPSHRAVELELLIERSTSISRARARRASAARSSRWSSSGDTSGRSTQRGEPAKPAVAMRTEEDGDGPWPRATKVTAVAQPTPPARRTARVGGRDRRRPQKGGRVRLRRTSLVEVSAHRRCAPRAPRRAVPPERRVGLASTSPPRANRDRARGADQYGNSQASRLKPRSIGAPSISWLPCLVMNAWMISSWFLPSSMSAASSVRISCEVMHGSSGTRRSSRVRRRRRYRRFRAASSSRTRCA